jgi:hypothetical protein
MAVLAGGSLTCVLEAKAVATADCTRESGQRREYADLLQAVLHRYAALTCEPFDIYCLLLGTHPLQPPPSSCTM